MSQAIIPAYNETTAEQEATKRCIVLALHQARVELEEAASKLIALAAQQEPHERGHALHEALAFNSDAEKLTGWLRRHQTWCEGALNG